ncbi:neuroendocrine protein 7B2 [Cylas formicarius]|uniref:neuroendocrine protein 7B2 n=1 Tax=Cylas formicarius TaxID=197179 RepID=UPI002958D7FE|nr:neuroendocrine protein 7B2 [Cylas formicarius]
MKVLFLICSLTGVFSYLPRGKESFAPGLFLRDLVSHMNGKKELSNGDISYFDFTDGLPLDGSSLTRDLEEEQMFPLDYDSLGDINMHPSIRDQEYIRHSSLWSNQYIPGSDGEQLFRPHGVKVNNQEVKAESTLPAYCNPPNPCPVGYTEEQGCLEDFENTASYSRRYQAMQDCMCDTEHMFDCPNSNNPMLDDPMESIAQVDFNRLMQQSFKINQGYPHKNLIAKKFHSAEKNPNTNPFLTGEKLPVAAKKGINML